MELEGISTDCLVLLLLLYFRLTSFHLESVSVALLFRRECSSQDFGQKRGWVVKGTKALLVSHPPPRSAAAAAYIIYGRVPAAYLRS